MVGAFSEDLLIEEPAIELFAGPGWQSIGAFDEAVFPGWTGLTRITTRRTLKRECVEATAESFIARN